MPTPDRLRYRIINHHTGTIINSYDSIINCKGKEGMQLMLEEAEKGLQRNP
ncbi:MULTISPECIES: hypothetical protein [Bacteroidales]|nr:MULTISPECIES: hypothetical protein [Bacteroidales]